MDAKTKKAMFALNDDLRASFPSNTMIMVNRSDLDAVVSHLYLSGDEWSNQSAFGYAIAAAESIEMSTEDIKKLTRAMRTEFDERTLESAADVYRKSDY